MKWIGHKEKWISNIPHDKEFLIQDSIENDISSIVKE